MDFIITCIGVSVAYLIVHISVFFCLSFMILRILWLNNLNNR